LAVGKSRDYLWLGAFGLAAALQIAGFAVPAADRDFAAVRFRHSQRADMPADLNGWSLVGYELVERGRNAQDGQFSSEWRYRRGPLECRVSVDYPFEGWHELTTWYTGKGWVRNSRRQVKDEQEGEAGTYIEAELSKPTGEYGWLLFGLFGRTGDHLVPTWVADGNYPSLREKLARSPLGSWLLGLRGGGIRQASYQVQVFASSAVGLSPAQRAATRQLFLSARSRVITACLRRATEVERKP
jgi:hypothetical protein